MKKAPVIGIVLVAFATTMFAASDIVVKILTVKYSVSFVMAVRFVVAVLLLIALLGPRIGRNLWHSQRRWLVLLRGFCLAVASLAIASALKLMPVGETIAITYLAPFGVMALAVPVLGERPNVQSWVGAAIGFLGVLFVIRPGTGLDPIGVALAVFGASLTVVYQLLTRLLGSTESTISLLFNAAIVAASVFCIMAVPQLPHELPSPLDFALMVMLGGITALGHFLFTAAYRHAPASQLAPINYLHILWVGLLGWLLFSHVPDRLTLLGMLLVGCAGVVVAFNSSRTARG